MDFSLFPITYQQIVIFLTVVREGGFAKAGSKLHITQSAISKNISKLEEILDIRLLSRTTREIVLTPAGQKLFDSWEPIINDISRTYKQALALQEERDTRLTVGLVNSTHPQKYIQKSLDEFRNSNPDISLTVKFQNVQRLEADMANGIFDLIVLPDFERFWTVDNNLSYKWIARDNAEVIISEKHPLADRESLKFEDLTDYVFNIPTYLASSSYLKDLRERFAPYNVNPKTVSVFDSAHDMQFLFSSSNPEIVFIDSFIDFPLTEGIKRIPVTDQQNGIIAIWNPQHMKRPLHTFLKII